MPGRQGPPCGVTRPSLSKYFAKVTQGDVSRLVLADHYCIRPERGAGRIAALILVPGLAPAAASFAQYFAKFGDAFGAVCP